MSRNYKFHNPKGTYFVSFAVVDWIDVFTRLEYKLLLVESLRFCCKEKGMELNAWVIMSNHLHLIFSSAGKRKPQDLLGDFKRYTSKSLVESIRSNPKESRKEWLLEAFRRKGLRTSNVQSFQFWRHDNRPIELWSSKVMEQKLDYLHMNPVKAGIVEKPHEYVFSSARNYAGMPAILPVIKL